MAEGIHPVNLGSITCTVILEGGMEPTVDTLRDRFPSVDARQMAVAFEKRLPSGVTNWSMNPLLIQTGDHTVLVDTGTGPSGQTNPRVASLVDPAQVDTVIITHGHGDHIGGLVDASGAMVYPNAHYHMHIEEWNQWMGPDFAAKFRDRVEYFQARLGVIKEKLNLLDGDTEIVPGITALLTPGHTNGHLSLLIESGGERLFAIVDVLHSPVQLDHPDWSPRFDTDPVLAAQTRRAVLGRAADENLLTLLYHFGFPGLGRVTRSGDAFDWKLADG